MDVLEPIEPEGMSGPLSPPLNPPSLGQPLGDPYGMSETMAVPPAPRHRRLARALVATAVVAGIAGAAIGIGVAGSGHSTLTLRPAASTGSSNSPNSSTPADGHVRNGAHFKFGHIVAGTVSKVSGNTITVTTPRANRTATVTTNAKTVYRKIVQGKVSDIKAKQTVAVVGTAASNGHLTATYVAIVPADLLKPAPPAGTPKLPKTAPSPPPGAPKVTPPHMANFALGQVTSVNGSSFVVTRRNGTTVTVDTTSTTKVFEEVAATAADVVPNVHIAAVGTPGTTPLTLTASRIEILPANLAGQSGPMLGLGFGFGFPFGGPGAGPGGPRFGGPGFGHGFGHEWGPRGPMGQPGSSSGPSTPATPATPQSVSV